MPFLERNLISVKSFFIPKKRFKKIIIVCPEPYSLKTNESIYEKGMPDNPKRMKRSQVTPHESSSTKAAIEKALVINIPQMAGTRNFPKSIKRFENQ